MSETVETVDQFIRAIRASEVLISEDPYGEACVRDAINFALNGVDGVTGGPVVPPPPSATKLREIHYIALDAAMRRLWQRHRIVYRLDPDLWRELGTLDRDAVVPSGLMTYLPHPDPFIHLPEPVILPVDGTHRQRVVGFFVAGTHPFLNGHMLTSTHSDSASGNLNLLIGSLVEYHDGRPNMVGSTGIQDMIWSRVTLDTSGGDTTVGQLVDNITVRFDQRSFTVPVEDTVPAMVTAAIAALIYLCSRNRDLAPVPARAVEREAARLGMKKPPTVFDVGGEIGVKLRAWHRAVARGEVVQTGGSKRAHVRRAHLHAYRVGPGREEIEMKFLAPMLINSTGRDADNTTVVSVD